MMRCTSSSNKSKSCHKNASTESFQDLHVRCYLHKSLINVFNDSKIIIIIINSYIFVTSIKSTHERLYVICIKWTKLSEIENHLQFIWLLHAVEIVSFETIYQIYSRWLHIKKMNVLVTLNCFKSFIFIIIFTTALRFFMMITIIQ